VLEPGRIWRVPVADVLYLRAELRYVTARTREREYLLDESLVKLEEEFAEDFLRIHRNCLVARRHLVGFRARSTRARVTGWRCCGTGRNVCRYRAARPTWRRISSPAAEFRDRTADSGSGRHGPRPKGGARAFSSPLLMA
jgi:hypothetical protein